MSDSKDHGVPVMDELTNAPERHVRRVIDSIPAPPDDALIGTLVDGKYHIESLLGEGGMGHVYRARHVMMGKLFAIKLIHAELAHVPEIAKRFHREARSSSLLTHPNCISVTDFGEYGEENHKNLFLAMELLEGEELDSKLQREKKIDPREAVGIITQVLKGLAHAHEQGVIHRDLKPENIFLIPQEDGGTLVKILDFGIAKMTDTDMDDESLTKTGVVFGTPKYLSPEQALGDKIDHRSDLYTVGVILFEMLTGEPPFRGKTAMDVMSAHLTAAPPKLGEYGSYPKGLQRIIQKAMSKRPDNRFADAVSFLSALDEINFSDNSEATTVVSPAVSVSREKKAKGRVGRVIRTILLFFLLLLVAIGAALHFNYIDRSIFDSLFALPGAKVEVENKAPQPEIQPLTPEAAAQAAIRSHLQAASEELAEDNFKEAENACRQALAIDAQNPAAKVMLGHILFESGRQVGGIYQYQQAIDSDPSQAANEQLRANLHDGLQWDFVRKKAAAMLAKYGNDDDIARLSELASSALTAGDVRRAVRSALDRADKGYHIDWVNSLEADFHELKNCKDRNTIIAQMVQTRNVAFIPFLQQFEPKENRKPKAKNNKKKPQNSCLKASIEYAIRVLSKQETEPVDPPTESESR